MSSGNDNVPKAKIPNDNPCLPKLRKPVNLPARRHKYCTIQLAARGTKIGHKKNGDFGNNCNVR